jgi:zinc transport system permease protein
VSALNYTLVLLAAVTVALAMRIVGVLLIGALMVVPVMTAMQLGRGFRATTIIAIAASLISTIVGLFASYALDLAPGGTIVVVALLLFVGSFFARAR